MNRYSTVSNYLWFALSGTDISASDTIQRIRSFANLAVGWHYGQGNPPSADAIDRAISLVNFAQREGFHKTDAFPGIEGSILTTVYYYTFTLEFEVRPDGLVDYILEKNDAEIDEEEGLTDEAARGKIASFGENLWNQFVFYTYNTMTENGEDLEAQPLVQQETHPASRLSDQSAYYAIVLPSVFTSGTFTDQFTASPPFFGHSNQIAYQPL